MKKIQIINGPNLNLLGKREPAVYGDASFEDHSSELHTRFPQCEVSYYQSNVEGEIIDKIHKVGFEHGGVVLNTGAYVHTSIASHDAVKTVTTPAVEVHTLNVHTRESLHHMSVISAAYRGVIPGLGLDSYRLTVESFMR